MLLYSLLDSTRVEQRLANVFWLKYDKPTVFFCQMRPKIAFFNIAIYNQISKMSVDLYGILK